MIFYKTSVQHFYYASLKLTQMFTRIMYTECRISSLANTYILNRYPKIYTSNEKKKDLLMMRRIIIQVDKY